MWWKSWWSAPDQKVCCKFKDQGKSLANVTIWMSRGLRWNSGYELQSFTLPWNSEIFEVVISLSHMLHTKIMHKRHIYMSKALYLKRIGHNRTRIDSWPVPRTHSSTEGLVDLSLKSLCEESPPNRDIMWFLTWKNALHMSQAIISDRRMKSFQLLNKTCLADATWTIAKLFCVLSKMLRTSSMSPFL